MTSIIIAGRPNSEEMSECIILSENISNLYPSSRFTIVLKHPNEWEQYCEDLCNLFGILKKTHPLILFSNGNQIGGTQQFFKLIFESFKFEALIKDEKTDTFYLNVNPVGISNLTRENTMLVEKEYICRTKDLFIADKIKNRLNDISIENFDNIYCKYNTIDDDFEEDYFNDMKVHVKYHQKFTPNPKEYKEEDDVIISTSVTIPAEEYNKFKEEEEEKKRQLEEMNKPKEEEKKDGEDEGEVQAEVEEGQEKQEGVAQNEKAEEEKKENQEKSLNEQNERIDTKESKKSKKGKDVVQNTKENVPEVEQNMTGLEEQKPSEVDKELKFSYFRDFDIPLGVFEDELIVERNAQDNFDLIINPYFTFYGETLINTIVDFVPKKEEKKEQIPIQKDEQIQKEGDDKPKEEEKVEEVPKEDKKEDEQPKEENKVDEQPKEEEKKEEKPVEEEKAKEEEKPKEEEKKEEEKSKEEEKKEEKIKKKEEEKKKEEKPQQQDNPKPQEGSKPEEASQKVPGEAEKQEFEHTHNPNLPTTSDPNSQNSKYPSKILIKDYGKLPSLRVMNYDDPEYPLYEKSIPFYQLPKNINNTSNLYNFAQSLFDEKNLPILIQMINETNGYATLRILPYKYSDWKSFASSKIRIIPKQTKELKLSSFPLEDKIAHQIQDIKRDLFNKTQTNSADKGSRPNYELIINNDEYSNCFKVPSYFTLDVYNKENIKHLIKYFPEGQFNLSNMKEAIKAMMSALEINNATGNGMIFICSQTFLFIAPLISPFAFTKVDTIPIFAEPHFFMGVYTLPFIEAEYPETIHRKYVKFDVVDILKKSTN